MSLLILFDGDGVSPLDLVGVDLLTRRLIRVELADEVVVNADYFDTSNYDVSVLSGTGEVEVIRILPFRDDSKVTTSIVIETQPLTLGTTYAVSIINARGRNGITLEYSSAKLDARYTKGDSILRSMPKHYDTRSTSNIAGVLLAIGRQDDLIGGSRDDDYTFD